MTLSRLQTINHVNVATKANVYFDGKVISHSVFLTDGTKKTIGLIFPGTYTFNTAAPEHMDITSGTCKVKRATDAAWTDYRAGRVFTVPGKSYFEISVESGMAEYVCSFE